MRGFLKTILVNLFTFFFISKFIGGIDFSEKISVLLLASFCLALFNLIIRPILNLLLMPINLLTLGAFRWVINLAVLYLVTLFVPEFRIVGFTFPGFSFSGFIIPEIRFSFFWSLILISFLIEIISGFISWLFK